MFIFADPRTWVGVAFIVFFLIFGKKLWLAVRDQLDAQRNAIRSDLEEAAALREEAEKIMQAAKTARQQAEKEAADLLERSKAEADFLEQETQKRLKEEADNYLKRTETQIEAMRQTAQEALCQEVLEKALQIAAEVMEKDLTQNPALQAAMIEKSFSSFSEA